MCYIRSLVGISSRVVTEGLIYKLEQTKFLILCMNYITFEKQQNVTI